jgi:hypothetical protein
MAQNLDLVEKVKELAAKRGVTAGQLALAWVHAQVSRGHMKEHALGWMCGRRQTHTHMHTRTRSLTQAD